MDERGREITHQEIKEETVYVLGKDKTPPLMTMWAKKIEPGKIIFWAGELQMNLILQCNDDGTLSDKTGAQIHIWEWNRPAEYKES